jgi:hypothetical protein
MEENLRKALQKANINPKENLADIVWQAVLTRERNIARIRLAIFSFIGIVSLMGLVPISKTLLNDFSQSGFYEYLSLAFSDSGAMITYWKEFSLLLAESLPAISIIFLFTLIFIFFLSLKYAIKEITRGQLSLSLSL